MSTLPAAIDPAPELPELALALGIGLLLGIERERRKGEGPTRGPAGIRTFALIGLVGGLAQEVGGVAVVAAAVAFVGLTAAAAYLRSEEEDPGLTTEMAMVVTLLLGALAQEHPGTAAAIAVAVALVLAHRERVHRLVRETLSEQELHDALLFASAALIVLPLIPDEGVGPNDALNPLTVWQLVVIVMSVQGLGYIALRAIGPRYGLLVSGFALGFVSSTATVAAMGSRAKEQPELRRPAVGAAVLSSVATVVLLAIVLAATSTEALTAVVLPLVLAGIAAAGYGAVVARRVVQAPPPRVFDQGRAFDLRAVAILALLVSSALLAAGALNEALGSSGVTLVAGVTGFADSQSGAVSASSLVGLGRIDAEDAVIPILLAFTTNTVSKAVVAYALGGLRYASEVWLGLAVMLAAGWAGWAIALAAGL